MSNGNGNGNGDGSRKNILARLRRVEGQIRGVQKMVESGKSCEEILIQVKAAQAALRSASGVMLKTYLSECHSSVQGANSVEALSRLHKTAEVITRFMD
jgi:CsoR family transcriptional regulator, copper-sensing transcriptional repressor